MFLATTALGFATAFCPTADPRGSFDRATVPTTNATGSVAAVDWTAIRAAYDAHRHTVVAQGDEFRARNPGEGWVTRFDGRGFTVAPDHGAWTWGLELAGFGFEGAQQTVASPAVTCAQGERVEYDWNARFTEWFVNDTRGLEHGFTVHERPEGGDGELVFTLRVRGELVPTVVDSGRGVRFDDAVGGAALTYAGLVAFDAHGTHLPARIERVEHGLALFVDERDARYPITIDPIATQQAYLKGPTVAHSDWFGYSVDVSGETVVVGTGRFNGLAHVFVRSGSVWSYQAQLVSSNNQDGDLFGRCVAISGDTIVVGAMGEDSNATGVNGNESSNSAADSGAAYVFVRSGTTWSQQAYLKASNTDVGDSFGRWVAIDGDTIVVTAPRERSNATGVDGDQSNNTLLEAGAAYVFVRSGTTWSQEAYLKSSNTGGSDTFFGDRMQVSVSGDTIVFGHPGEDSSSVGVNSTPNEGAANAGAAYVFVRSGTTWTPQAYLKASNSGAGDLFGNSVSVSGDTIAVGAFGEASNATGVNGNQTNDSLFGSGAAYVFVRSGTTWTQQAYVKASNTDLLDNFGFALSLSGDTLVVGAPAEDSSATGVDGNQGNGGFNTGATYVFRRNGVLWSQVAYLKASNAGDGDTFEESATFRAWIADAVDGNIIVAGAPYEDSNATGVNGNEANESTTNAGAAYVFAFEPPSYSSYCSGDGSLATPCPCAAPNTVPSPPAAPGHGCANSLNLDGALLSAGGTLSPDTLTIQVNVAPLYAGFAFLVKGNATNNNGIAASDGVRCADGALIRFGSHNAGTNGNPSGQWIYPNTAQTTAISTLTLQPPGQTAYYQLFYRNAAANFCTSATANWSSGLVVSWP